ncbi:MAG TPA: polysaccharide biosynthesis tyrosine autokinase [Chitinophagaceae bacterium]
MKKTNLKNGTPTLIEDITHKYVPYWPLLVLLAIPCFMLAWVYLKVKAPVYEVVATIQVKDEKKGVNEDEITESINMLSSKSIVENEVEVIHSRTFTEEVVKDLKLYAPMFQRGDYRSVSAYLTSPVTVQAENPDNLVEVPEVPFSYDFNTRTVKIGKKTFPLNRYVSTEYGRLMFTPNPRFVKSGEGQLYFSLIDPRKVTDGLYAALDISAVGKLSSIVKLKFKDVVPQRGEDIVNLIIEKYSKAQIEYKTGLAKNTMAFLDQRIAKVVGDLNGVERRVQRFRSDKGVVNLTDQSRLYLQNVAMNDQKLADLNMQLSVLDQVEKYMVSKNTAAGIAPATLGVNDPLIGKLLEKYYETELQYEKLKQTTGENNPSVQALSTQINSLKPTILENVRNQRINVQASLANLALTNNGYNSMLETIPAKERELLDVSRQQSTLSSLYNFLLQKREQAALAYSSDIAETQVIDKASASVLPVSPNKKFTYAAALALALLLTVGYILYRDILSNKVLFRSDIVNNTSYPLLAEISYIKKGKQMLLTGADFSTAQDEFRQLCIAAGFFLRGNDKKKILVTSSNEGEGKSLVLANIALTLSQAGKRVVLIDADMESQQLSRSFRAIGSGGLSEFLSGATNNPGSLIRSTGYQNLSLISAGEPKPGASTLLLNGNMEALIQELAEKFDFVLVDAPPVNPAADAYILSAMCDTTLYVIRHRFTAKSVIRKLDETNELKPLKGLALVFNGIRSRGFILKSRGFGYGHKHQPSSRTIWSKFGVRKNGAKQQAYRGVKPI